MDEPLPSLLLLTVCDLPIKNLPFATAVGPQAQGDEHHDALAALLMTLALAAILFETLLLRLHAHPDTIELHHRRHIANRLMMNLGQTRFELIYSFIDRSQPYT